MLSAVLVDCLLLGAAVATACWYVRKDTALLPCTALPFRVGFILSETSLTPLHVSPPVSTCRLVANRFLRRRNLPQHQVEQHLEWYGLLCRAVLMHDASYIPPPLTQLKLVICIASGSTMCVCTCKQSSTVCASLTLL